MEQSEREREIHVHSDIQPIAEALLYYIRRANGRPMSAAIRRMREQYPESRESIDSLFGPLEDLERTLDDAVSQVDEERMHFFFDNLGEAPTRNRRIYEANLATAIMIPNPFDNDVPTDLREYCVQRKAYTQEEIIFFARFAFSLPNELWQQKECRDLAAFYDYLTEYPATDGERFRILSIVRGFSRYVDELEGLLEPVVAAIAENRTSYQPLLERFAQVYQGKQPDEMFGTPEDVHICDASATVLEVFPRLFAIDEYYTMTYRLSDDTPICNHIEVGVLYDAAKQYRKREIPLRDIAACIKVIGDPVRLQILSLLKDEEVYVQDLTEKLGLSFTTVSHHMAKLMMAGLVDSERRGIFVYYKANAAFIRWIMDRVSEFLLD
ncbi:MAG: ArsR/SmtB family transcription factor [Faecousia sp.]